MAARERQGFPRTPTAGANTDPAHGERVLHLQQSLRRRGLAHCARCTGVTGTALLSRRSAAPSSHPRRARGAADALRGLQEKGRLGNAWERSATRHRQARCYRGTHSHNGSTSRERKRDHGSSTGMCVTLITTSERLTGW